MCKSKGLVNLLLDFSFYLGNFLLSNHSFLQEFVAKCSNRAFRLPRGNLFGSPISKAGIGTSPCVASYPIGLAFYERRPMTVASAVYSSLCCLIDFQHRVSVYFPCMHMIR